MLTPIYTFLDQYVIHPVPMTGSQLALVVSSLLIILAFELWMLVDVLALRKIPRQSRLLWVLGMFLIHPVVAMVYLFARHRYSLLK
jgi:hypothetical protein